jgi:hypothetical protein
VSAKQTHDVFGISNTILRDSYVDRGALDEKIAGLLKRSTHVAIRGESKCGKSWLRQRQIPDTLIVQCRLHKSAVDLYVDALSQLGITLEVERTAQNSLRGKASATGEFGSKLLAKLGFGAELGGEHDWGDKKKPVGHDVHDLRFVVDTIKASECRLVIEDFHYMSVEERRKFAFDLKAMWDMGLFAVVVGVWSMSNMLIFLNPDLTGRIAEVPIYWSNDDLGEVMTNGGQALNISFSDPMKRLAIENCFGNVGILQTLVLGVLDHLGIKQGFDSHTVLNNPAAVDSAAMEYADQLNPLYQQFAKRVSGGIRRRTDSTGIYAHAVAVILETPDEELIRGVSLDTIFDKAHARQPRIKKHNLRTVLEKFEELQVDDDGRGLVLSYNDSTGEVSVVDRQLLLYRKYATVKWPWEDIVREADASGKGFGADAEAVA